MASLGAHKSKLVLAAVILGSLLAWYWQHGSEKPPARGEQPAARQAAAPPTGASAKPAQAKFDFYLLAMSVHAAFCADGHQQSAECRTPGQWPLVIHGLWPENLEPRSYPHDCPAPELALDPMLEQQLQEYMPGMAAGLHEYEWRKHGGCSGLDDDVYFSSALGLARTVDGALAARLTTLAGGEASPTELRDSADMFRPGVGATLTFHCRSMRGSGKRPVLFEVRQCVDNDGAGGAPGTPLDCASLNRRDQGCGNSFLVPGHGR